MWLKIAGLVVWEAVKSLLYRWLVPKSPVKEVEREVQEAHKVQNSIERMPDSAIDQQLRSKWQRD